MKYFEINEGSIALDGLLHVSPIKSKKSKVITPNGKVYDKFTLWFHLVYKRGVKVKIKASFNERYDDDILNKMDIFEIEHKQLIRELNNL